MVYGWILARLMSWASVMRSQMCLVRVPPPHDGSSALLDELAEEEVVVVGVMIPISAVVSLPRLRIKAVKGIPFPLPLAPLFVRSASHTLRCLKIWDGSCSRQSPTVVMRWTIRLRAAGVAVAGAGAAVAVEPRTIVWISLMALKRVATGRVAPPNDDGVSSFDKCEA